MYSLAVILCRKKVDCSGSDKIAILNKVTFLNKFLVINFNDKRKRSTRCWDRRAEFLLGYSRSAAYLSVGWSVDRLLISLDHYISKNL